MDYEFTTEKRREVIVQLARHLGTDKPVPPVEGGGAPEPKVARMRLCRRDERGHEESILEWDKSELNGKGVSLDGIVTSVGLAACRDAAYQYASECLYVLVFLSKENQSRSRLFFKLAAGQEISQMAQASLPGALGSGERKEPLGVADLLRYVQAKEERLDKKQEGFVDSLLKERDQLHAIKTEYTDREMHIRQIELAEEDHEYERAKKRREDEQSMQMKKEAWAMVKDHGPKLLPYVIAGIQRLSRGPQGAAPLRRRPPQAGAAGYDSNFDAWYAAQGAPGAGQVPEGPGAAAASVAAAPVAAAPVADAWYGSHAAPQSPPASSSSERGAPPVGQPTGEGTDLDVLRARVAFDAARFIILCRGRGQLDAVRGALSEEQLRIFDRIDALSVGALDTDAEIGEMARSALMFGLSVQADPTVGVRLLAATEPMLRAALADLSNLLQAYYRASASGAAPGGG